MEPRHTIYVEDTIFNYATGAFQPNSAYSAIMFRIYRKYLVYEDTGETIPSSVKYLASPSIGLLNIYTTNNSGTRVYSDSLEEAIAIAIKDLDYAFGEVNKGIQNLIKTINQNAEDGTLSTPIPQFSYMPSVEDG